MSKSAHLLTLEETAATQGASPVWVERLTTPPVIHCTECKYFGPSEYAGYWHCENWGVESNALTAKPETFYCADAERKEP